MKQYRNHISRQRQTYAELWKNLYIYKKKLTIQQIMITKYGIGMQSRQARNKNGTPTFKM